MLESNTSNKVKSLSVALGIFCGIAPFWGFQTVITITLAVLLRLNKSIAFVCSNISIPPMIPFIIFASMQLGSLFVKGNPLLLSQEITIELVKNHLIQYIIGSLLLATLCASLSGSIIYIILKLNSK